MSANTSAPGNVPQNQEISPEVFGRDLAMAAQGAPSAMGVTISPPPPPGPIAEFWSHFRQNKGAVVGMTIIILVALAAIFAPFLAPFDPNVLAGNGLTPPAWQEGGVSAHLLGTDRVGRDLLSRLIYGARYSLLVGVIVVTISLTIGILLGMISGFFGGRVDFLIMRAMDVILSLPSLLMALVIIAILEKSLTNAMIAIAITVVPHYARLVRASVLTEMAKDYVVASRVAGAGNLRLMFSTIFPNCLAPLIVQATLSFSSAILDAAALGFLGYGAQPPTPEWGSMLSEAFDLMQRAPWVITFPGLAILITVLAFNVMGDGMRDALDPRLKK